MSKYTLYHDGKPMIFKGEQKIFDKYYEAKLLYDLFQIDSKGYNKELIKIIEVN